jgi:hypothetical protein
VAGWPTRWSRADRPAAAGYLMVEVEVFTMSYHVGKVRGGSVKWRVMHSVQIVGTQRTGTLYTAVTSAGNCSVTRVRAGC